MTHHIVIFNVQYYPADKPKYPPLEKGFPSMKNRIKELREEKGITQEQLGALVGVSRQAINALETGRYEPSIWLAYDIAGVFGCFIEEVFLFGESPRKSRSDKSRGNNFTQKEKGKRKNGNTAAAISGR